MNVWFLSTDAALCQWLTAAIMKTFCKCSLCVRRVVNIFFVMSEVVGPCRPLSAPCSRVVSQPGAVASSCNPATWRQVLLDGLRRGLLMVTGSC